MTRDATGGYLIPQTPSDICALWESFKGYTVRPVPSTETYYETRLSRLGARGRQVLVYGGTPEIRNVILRVAASATIVDRSKAMVEAMGLLTSGRCLLNPNERFVEADWLEIPLDDGHADIAIGDDAINMVDWEKFDEFAATTARLLKPGGHFICHLLVRPDESLRNTSVAQVLQDYRDGVIRSQYDLASRLNFVFYDNRTYRMGWQASLAGIRRLLEENTADEYRELADFISRFQLCNSSFACPPVKEWEELITRYFTIEEVFTPREHDYCQFEPVYLLRRR
jgi:SAM-dependent methyltransferase